MRNRALENWAWVLIYAGLLVTVLGLFLRPEHAAVAGGLMAGGGMAAAAGVVLIWWRSKRKD